MRMPQRKPAPSQTVIIKASPPHHALGPLQSKSTSLFTYKPDLASHWPQIKRKLFSRICKNPSSSVPNLPLWLPTTGHTLALCGHPQPGHADGLPSVSTSGLPSLVILLSHSGLLGKTRPEHRLLHKLSPSIRKPTQSLRFLPAFNTSHFLRIKTHCLYLFARFIRFTRGDVCVLEKYNSADDIAGAQKTLLEDQIQLTYVKCLQSA